jgi:hypothetical protein
MAKPVRITYSRRDSIKIGDFESLTPSWGEEWELEEGDKPGEIRKALVERVDSMFQTVARRQLKQVIERRVNVRDQETEEYMDEACDYFKVSQGRKGGRK